MPAIAGGPPTRSDIEAWDTTHLEAAATNWKSTAAHWESHFETIHTGMLRPGGTAWEGTAADAAAERSWGDLVKVRGAGDALYAAARHATTGAEDIAWTRRQVLEAITDAEEAGLTVGQDFSITDKSVGVLMRSTAARQQQAQAYATEISARVQALTALDKQVAAKITTALAPLDELRFGGPADGPTPPRPPKDHAPAAQAVDYHQIKDAPPVVDPNSERTHNQAAAFRELYGHDPVSTNDWQMAAVLDANSYDPNDKGKRAEVRVVRIRPVPGQGLLRMSQWIEQRDVSNVPPSRDFGNNRTADAHFDPANTKVTTYIDYEHGVVVMRQNPSIEQTDTGGAGQVKVQAPHADVTQTPDGSVRIRYSAGNPFAPPIAQAPPGPLADHPWTVNGDLVFSPGAGGVHVDGTRGDYPSMEVYQDLPGGTHTVLIDPAQSGRSWGPVANLPYHHDVGIGGRAFEPFDRAGWNPRYDVAVPLPATDLGLPSDPPSVPSLPPTTAVPS